MTFKLKTSSILPLLGEYLPVALALWTAWFWDSASFALYGEDLYRVEWALAPHGRMSLFDVFAASIRNMNGILFGVPVEGRVLHPTLIYGFSALGNLFGGLRGVYGIAFLLSFVNALLFRALLRRLANGRLPGLLEFFGTLAFCLFPADTTKAWLTSAFGIQPGLTLILIAFLLWDSRARPAGYVVAFCSLFVYESFFPLFLLAPFTSRRPLPDRRRLFLHALLLGAILVVVVLLRKIGGEARVDSLPPGRMLWTSMRQMLAGPPVSLGAFVYRPLTAASEGTLASLCALIAATIPLLLWKTRTWSKEVLTSAAGSLPAELRRPALIGLAWMVLGYALAFFPNAWTLGGRFSRVHAAAAPGACILFACAMTAAFHAMNRRRAAVAFALACGAYFALLLEFGFVVQRDYVTDAAKVRGFWTDVARLAPDLTDGTVVAVEGQSLNRVGDRVFAGGIAYTDLGSAFAGLYAWPTTFRQPPTMVRLSPLGVARLESAGGELDLGPITFEGLDRRVHAGDLVFLEVQDGKLSRPRKARSPFLRPPPDGDRLPPLTPGPLYPVLIDPRGPDLRYLEPRPSVGYYPISRTPRAP